MPKAVLPNMAFFSMFCSASVAEIDMFGISCLQVTVKEITTFVANVSVYTSCPAENTHNVIGCVSRFTTMTIFDNYPHNASIDISCRYIVSLNDQDLRGCTQYYQDFVF